MRFSNPKMHQIRSTSWWDGAHFPFSKNPLPTLGPLSLALSIPTFLVPGAASDRSILIPLLGLTPPTEGFSWDDLRKILHGGLTMASVQNGEEILMQLLLYECVFKTCWNLCYYYSLGLFAVLQTSSKLFLEVSFTILCLLLRIRHKLRINNSHSFVSPCANAEKKDGQGGHRPRVAHCSGSASCIVRSICLSLYWKIVCSYSDWLVESITKRKIQLKVRDAVSNQRLYENVFWCAEKS